MFKFIALGLLAASTAQMADTPNAPPSAASRKAIMAAVGDKLLDGESARYRWPNEPVKPHAGYCGFVNAKNSYGAYTGFKPFEILGLHSNNPNDHHVFVAFSVELSSTDEDLWKKVILPQCIEMGYDMDTLPPDLPQKPNTAPKHSTSR
jgi:hypothetical protein